MQFPKWQLPKSVLASVIGPQSVLAAALGHHCSLRRLRGPNLTFGKSPLGKLHIWEIVTWKVVLGKKLLEKYLKPLKLLYDSPFKCQNYINITLFMQMYVEVQIMHFSVPFSIPQAKFFISLENNFLELKHNGF